VSDDFPCASIELLILNQLLGQSCRQVSQSWTANERPRLSLPCPDACNLAPVFNHGVLLLLCGGSSKHFFIGSEIS
jgi:hypothetical protein